MTSGTDESEELNGGGSGPDKPGKRVLLISIVIYLAALGIISAGLLGDPAKAMSAVKALYLSPLFLILLPIIYAPTVFIVGYATGVPLMSFGYALRRMWWHVYRVLSAILLVAVVIAFLWATL